MSNNFMRKYIDIINEGHMPGHRMYNKIEANYTDQAIGDNRCANCAHFKGPNHCELVMGEVSPMGWCKYYESTMMEQSSSGYYTSENYRHLEQQPDVYMHIDEKWGKPTKVSPEERGKYAGKTKAELLKQYNALKKSGPHKKGSPQYGKMRELAFAIRAKSDWGRVQGK